ncbi:UNVERIFIED_CONTAM: hypothetical protein HDU68_010297 [Siphonaria sp. JEL0065]|nr:hypothetical protein HDU68_010297 [Siphonaria sp. JEL0065]
MSEIDELHSLRKAFATGAYQLVINEATNPGLRVSPGAQQERKVYLYRAYVAQGRANMAVNEIRDSDPVELRAVRALARKNPDEAQQLLSEGTPSPLLATIVASVLYNADRFRFRP